MQALLALQFFLALYLADIHLFSPLPKRKTKTPYWIAFRPGEKRQTLKTHKPTKKPHARIRVASHFID